MKIYKVIISVLLSAIYLYSMPNETLFFTADDGTHGNELWKYDQSNGMGMIDDANSHSQSISVSEFQNIGNNIYVSLNKNDNNGTQIWSYSDGTLVPVTDSSSVGTSFNPSNLFSLNNKLYFTASDEVNGTEIRTLDDNNLSQIIQTNIFTKDSSPSNFISFNGKVIFTANTPEYGTELYESNGTNISLVSDIYSGSGSSSPSNFIEYNGKLYFTANDPNYGNELRVYDGTSVSLVQDLDIGATSSNISYLIVYDNKLYFRAQYLNGYELYSFDGTSIELAADIGTNEYSSSPNNLTLFDNKLYFSANSIDNGNELYYYDSSDNNYTLVSDIYTGNGGSNPSYLTVAGNKLFFSARADDNDQELYYTTGGNNISKVNVYSGTYTSNSNTYQNQASPSYLTEFNGNLYFRANGTTGRELYMYNNSTENSGIVLDIYTGTYTSGSNTYQNNGDPSNFIEYNNKLYFVAQSKLYAYDGTNTPAVVDNSYSSPRNLYVANNKLYFVDNGDGSEYDKDYSLHSYDGTNFSNIVDYNNFYETYYYNNMLYISANSLNYGRELFIYDGTNTSLVQDMNTYSENLSFGTHVEFNGSIVFSGSDDRYGNELWEFNGTKVNLISDIQSGRTSSSPSNFVEMDNKLYFTCNYPSKGVELCVYDGSNVTLAADIDIGSESSSISELTVNGSTLYFRASTDENGNELWKYESGTASLVGDIFPGNNTNGYVNSSSPYYLTSVGDRVYFRANNSDTTGQELYYADSTGTHLAVDLYPGSYTSGSNTYQNSGNPSNLTEYNGKIYFTANLDSKGTELYLFNENNSTYSLIKDIYEGSSSSSPTYLTVVNGKLVFRANTENNGTELFIYDGSDVTMIDIDPTIQGNGYPRSSYPSNINVIGDKLFFTANSLQKGQELYVYDGSSVSSLGDMNPKTNSYNFSQFSFYKNELYFSGSTDDNGTELWKYDFENVPVVQSDIKPGYNSSSPYYLTKFLNKLYFRASTENNGTELISFDGDNHEIIDIQPGSGSSSPSSLIVYKKELLFLGSGEDGYGAYKYNGFSKPSKLSDNSSGFSYPTVCNDILYFQASGTDGSGNELWKYDGNTTSMVSDIHPTSSSSPSYLTCAGDKLYFRANDPIYGNYELWTLDGNTTSIVEDIYSGTSYYGTPFSSSVSNLKAVGNSLYFTAQNDVNGSALYTYDGVNLTMYDDELGKTSNSSYDMIEFNNSLYKELRDESNKYYLSIFPNDTNIGNNTFNNMSNFKVVNPQPLINNTEDIIIDEDNGTIHILFNGFADPDNRDLNITLEHNASTLLDVSTSFVSGVQSHSEYNGLEINITATTKENANGLVVFYVTVDNGLDTTTEKVFVQINPVDDAPIFTSEPQNIFVNPNMGVGIQTISASDVDGDVITYSASSSDTSIVTVSVNENNVTFTPVSTGYGSTTNVDINITASGVNVGRSITYTYVPPNTPPTSKSVIVSLNEDSNYTFSLNDFNFTDIDSPYGDSLESIYITALESEGDLTINGNEVILNQEINTSKISSLVFSPEVNENGTPYSTFAFRVNDGDENSTNEYIVTLNVTAIDDTPTLDLISNVMGISEDSNEFNVTLSSNDIDGDTVTYTATSSNTNIAIVSIVDGKVKITPVSNMHGTISIEVNATANGQVATQSFDVEITDVNDKPTFTSNLADLIINEDNGTTSYELNITDIENDELNITVESNDTTILNVTPSWNGLLNHATYNNQAFDFNLTTLKNANGMVKITITVSDDELENTQTFDINVTAVNDAPTLSSLSDKIVYKNFNDINYTLPATDVDGDILDYSVIAQNPNMVNLNVTNNIVSLQSINGQSGITDVNITVSDDEYSVSEMFTLQILSFEDGDSVEEKGDVNQSTDENGTQTTIITVPSDNLVVEIKENTNGIVSHEIDLGDKKVVATSEINGSVVEVTNNGVHTKYEDNTSSLVAEANATITGLATHTLDINGTKIQAKSEIIGAITNIKDINGSVQIETSVTNDNNVSFKVVAKQNGEASHTVELVNGDISQTTAKIAGAQTIIKIDNSVETKASIGTKDATVITKEDGTNTIEFKDGNITINPLAIGSSFEADSTSTIEDINGSIQITVESPLTQALQF